MLYISIHKSRLQYHDSTIADHIIRLNRISNWIVVPENKCKFSNIMQVEVLFPIVICSANQLIRKLGIKKWPDMHHYQI